MKIPASKETREIIQFYNIIAPDPETGEAQSVRMEVKVNFEAIAKQLGPNARKQKKRIATALHGAVTVRALKNERP